MKNIVNYDWNNATNDSTNWLVQNHPKAWVLFLSFSQVLPKI